MVYGEGKPDARLPDQQYDEKGRPVNPETKKIIKETIRAHNEVMQVIGVAEPENNTASKEAEREMAEQYEIYENETGRYALEAGRMLSLIGVWGVHGTRQRLLVWFPTPCYVVNVANMAKALPTVLSRILLRALEL